DSAAAAAAGRAHRRDPRRSGVRRGGDRSASARWRGLTDRGWEAGEARPPVGPRRLPSPGPSAAVEEEVAGAPPDAASDAPLGQELVEVGLDVAGGRLVEPAIDVAVEDLD